MKVIQASYNRLTTFSRQPTLNPIQAWVVIPQLTRAYTIALYLVELEDKITLTGSVAEMSFTSKLTLNFSQPRWI